MKIIKNTSWCHLSLVTLVSVTVVSFLSWLIHKPYLHLLPSYSFGLPSSPPPPHKLWCQTFFLCLQYQPQCMSQGIQNSSPLLLEPEPCFFLSHFYHCHFRGNTVESWTFSGTIFLIFFFCQKFSCTERSKVNVSLFREMEVLQIVSQSLI